MFLNKFTAFRNDDIFTKKMHWQEHEIRELLTIRGLEVIRRQITGTTKDSVVYNRVKKLLQDRGINRTHMQVITKLKSLRKQYYTYHREKILSGSDRVDWLFYELCHRAFGDSPGPGITVKRSRSPSPSFEPSPAAPTPPSSAVSEKPQPVEDNIWDGIEETEINEHLAPVEADDDNEEDLIPPEHPHPLRTSESCCVETLWRTAGVCGVLGPESHQAQGLV